MVYAGVSVMERFGTVTETFLLLFVNKMYHKQDAKLVSLRFYYSRTDSACVLALKVCFAQPADGWNRSGYSLSVRCWKYDADLQYIHGR